MSYNPLYYGVLPKSSLFACVTETKPKTAEELKQEAEKVEAAEARKAALKALNDKEAEKSKAIATSADALRGLELGLVEEVVAKAEELRNWLAHHSGNTVTGVDTDGRFFNACLADLEHAAELRKIHNDPEPSELEKASQNAYDAFAVTLKTAVNQLASDLEKLAGNALLYSTTPSK